MTREARVIPREAGAGAERVLPHRAGKSLRERRERRPSLRAVVAGAGHQRGRRRRVEQLGDLRHVGRLDRPRSRHGTRRRHRLVRGRLEPVVHRHEHQRGTALVARGVPRAGDRRRYVLRAHRLLDRHRIAAGEPVQLPGQERVERQVAPVLLAHDDHERRAVHARRRQPCDRVAEAGRGVQQHQRGLLARQGPAGREPHHRRLVQRQHEVEIVRQADQERHLGRARVREQRRQPMPPEHLERPVADQIRRVWVGCPGNVPEDFTREADDGYAYRRAGRVRGRGPREGIRRATGDALPGLPGLWFWLLLGWVASGADRTITGPVVTYMINTQRAAARGRPEPVRARRARRQPPVRRLHAHPVPRRLRRRPARPPDGDRDRHRLGRRGDDAQRRDHRAARLRRPARDHRPRRRPLLLQRPHRDRRSRRRSRSAASGWAS